MVDKIVGFPFYHRDDYPADLGGLRRLNLHAVVYAYNYDLRLSAFSAGAKLLAVIFFLVF